MCPRGIAPPGEQPAAGRPHLVTLRPRSAPSRPRVDLPHRHAEENSRPGATPTLASRIPSMTHDGLVGLVTPQRGAGGGFGRAPSRVRCPLTAGLHGHESP